MSNNVMILVNNEDSDDEKIMKYELVCSVCTSTRTVSPLPPWARGWLSAAAGGGGRRGLESGVCALCAPWLRRSVRFWERARRAQAVLMQLRDSGQFSIARLKELNSTAEHQPFVQLSTRIFGPNDHVLIKWDEDSSDNFIVIEKKETEEIKIECDFSSVNNHEFGVIDETVDSDSDTDVKKPIKTVRKVKIKRDDRSDNDNDEALNENDSDDFKSDEELIKIVKDDKVSKVNSKKPSKASSKKRESDQKETLAELSKRLTKRSKKAVKETKPTKTTDEMVLKYFNVNPYTVQEQKASTLKKKTTEKYLKSTFKCETCIVGFMEQEKYDTHVAEHPKTGKTCRVCLRHYVAHTFPKHMRWHMTRWLFSCKHCVYTTDQTNLAKLHAAMHDGKTIECKICGKTFSRRKSLSLHLNSKHADHVCNLCGHSFVGEFGLRCHWSLKHKGKDVTIPEDGPQCAECDIRFQSTEAFETHRRVSQRHKVKGRRTGPPVDLRRKRETARLLHCEQCGIELAGIRAYQLHFAKHHPTAPRPAPLYGKQPSLCNVCGSYTSNMNTHMLTHSAAAERCPEPGCGKAFRTRQNMLTHLETHREPKHACPTCGKRFNSRSNLNRHFTYTHSTVRDVKCEYCDRYFKNVAERHNHTNYVHLKKPWPKKSQAKSGRKRAGRSSDEDGF